MGNEVSGRKKVVGASFSLHPMCDDFVAVIEGALSETDTSKVWLETDDVTTTIRGRVIHVFNVINSICVYAARTGRHVAFQATFSNGCLEDSENDRYLQMDDSLPNLVSAADREIFAAAKFSLYPLQATNYIGTILEQIELMKERVDVSKTHFSTKLEGSLVEIFTGLERAFEATILESSSHTVMTVSVSMNSPSH